MCGQEFADGNVCCTADQVDALNANLEQAEVSPSVRLRVKGGFQEEQSP